MKKEEILVKIEVLETELSELKAMVNKPFNLFKPKDGDIVFLEDIYGSKFIYIYKNTNDETINCYYLYSIENGSSFCTSFSIGGKETEATKEQKQLLFDVLAKQDKQWNSTKKCLIELNTPEIGDDCIIWETRFANKAIISELLDIIKTHKGIYYKSNDSWNDNCIKWDGSKKQLNDVRKGIK